MDSDVLARGLEPAPRMIITSCDTMCERTTLPPIGFLQEKLTAGKCHTCIVNRIPIPVVPLNYLQ